MIRPFTLTLATMLLAATAASAADTRPGGLVQARQKVARAASQTKGGAQQRLLLEQRKLDRMISDLESGRDVDPTEIDRAIERAGRATH